VGHGIAAGQGREIHTALVDDKIFHGKHPSENKGVSPAKAAKKTKGPCTVVGRAGAFLSTFSCGYVGRY
jgi:hypothetical protein